MGSRHIVLLCILIGAALYCSVTADDEPGPNICCFKYKPNTKPDDITRFITRLESYYMSDKRCPKAGVIVITKKGKILCMDPTLPWVQKIMEALDNPSF